jgi:hypothetical protein
LRPCSTEDPQRTRRRDPQAAHTYVGRHSVQVQMSGRRPRVALSAREIRAAKRASAFFVFSLGSPNSSFYVFWIHFLFFNARRLRVSCGLRRVPGEARFGTSREDREGLSPYASRRNRYVIWLWAQRFQAGNRPGVRGWKRVAKLQRRTKNLPGLICRGCTRPLAANKSM